MKNTANTSRQAAQGEQLSWLEMSAEDFGDAPQAVQGALFQAPDAFGTLDLFDTAGE